MLAVNANCRASIVLILVKTTHFGKPVLYGIALRCKKCESARTVEKPCI